MQPMSHVQIANIPPVTRNQQLAMPAQHLNASNNNTAGFVNNMPVATSSGKSYSVEMMNGRKVIVLSGANPLPLLDLSDTDALQLKQSVSKSFICNELSDI